MWVLIITQLLRFRNSGPAHGLSQGCSQADVQSSSRLKLGWPWWICDQDGSLTRLLAGHRSSPWGRLHRLLFTWLTWLGSWLLQSQWLEGGGVVRAKEGATVFHDLAPEWMCHHFCPMLLVTKTNPGTVSEWPPKGIKTKRQGSWGGGAWRLLNHADD